MKTREENLIALFDKHCEATGLAPATVGFKANRDNHLYERLKRGGSCSPRIYLKIYEWFQENSPPPKNNHKTNHHTESAP